MQMTKTAIVLLAVLALIFLIIGFLSSASNRDNNPNTNTSKNRVEYINEPVSN